jgi:hypothetical protein
MSGYPFEMALHQQFQAAGMDGGANLRVHVTDDRTVEVDFMASAIRDVTHPGHGIRTGVTAVVEAKRFHPPKEFVGFLAEPLSEHQRQIARCRVSGAPTWNVLHDGGVVPPWVQRLLPTCDPLIGADWCSQWGDLQEAKGKPEKPDRPARIMHCDDTWNHITRVIDAAQVMAVESSRLFLGYPAMVENRQTRIGLIFPVLAIDVPWLYVYDGTNKRLRRSKWIVLQQMIDIRGEVRSRLVDVVCPAGVPLLIAAYQKAAAQMMEVVEKEDVSAIAKKQSNDLARGKVDTDLIYPGIGPDRLMDPLKFLENS